MNFLSVMTSVIIAAALQVLPPPVKEPEPELIKVSATAYYDIFGYGYGADGSPLVEGLTLAGKSEWLGKSAVLYDSDMNYIGIYEFRDVGFGQETGYGQSKLLNGKTIGTIEAGTCIDIYFKTYEACKEWGRRQVYIQIIEAEG